MKLQPRLTLFTAILILGVVTFTGVSTIVTLRHFLRTEMKSNQETWFNNFRNACTDAIYLGDTLAIQSYSESLERSVPELAYAVFVDASSPETRSGGLESVQRFNKLNPTCSENNSSQKSFLYKDDERDGARWGQYCQHISQTNVQGMAVNGVVFVGFNINILETKLDSIIAL